jgi:hypothetical protein
MFEQLKQMNEELEALKKAHLEKSKLMFTDVAKSVFDKHPKLESFGWNQYTPYFNDGDECTFSANIDYVDINGENEYDSNVLQKTIYVQNAKGEYIETVNELYNPELAAAQNDVKEFLSNIDESVLRDMFGDHVEVTVSRNGTEVEKYEHD